MFRVAELEGRPIELPRATGRSPSRTHRRFKTPGLISVQGELDPFNTFLLNAHQGPVWRSMLRLDKRMSEFAQLLASLR